ncbi:peptidase C15 [Starkeya koreensis]|uniref:Pyroglutamyl-peptidase I n=1 Tax=Ancylobacter koreensis TaxID=266121 RepID=A0ABT0DP63_9HYPH|nr:peptidase C15 [Ancylobacter koreensis]
MCSEAARPARGDRPRILVTGFGRFPGMPSNPSASLARALARGRSGAGRVDARIEARILPTLWSEATAFPALLDAAAPDIVLMLGVAGRRRQVCIECVARNATGVFPDTARRRPGGRRLEIGAPAQRALAASPMPLLRALRLAGLPARLSRDAGGYVCNALAWRGYGWAAEGQRLAVFIHIPLPRPGALSRQRLQRGLEALLVALVAQWRQHSRAVRTAKT